MTAAGTARAQACVVGGGPSGLTAAADLIKAGYAATVYEALPEAARGRWVESVQDILPEVHRCVDAGDVVLVKGSKGSKVSLVVDVLRKLGQRSPNPETET